MRKTLSRLFHWLFEIGVIIKGIDGILEVIGGFLLMLVTQRSLNHLVAVLTVHELSRDPDDAIVHWLITAVSHVDISAKLFGSLYLLSHGVLKIFLVYNLLKERLWVFPVAIAVMEAFVLYQLYRIAGHHSFALKIFTGLDLLVIFFIWMEWRTRRKVIVKQQPAC